MNTPLTIGRIVCYVLSQQDADKINAGVASGLIEGNPHTPGQVVPAIVVQPWSDECFNGQALIDGTMPLWLLSRVLDQDEKAPGTWHWPEYWVELKGEIEETIDAESSESL